MFQIAKNKIEVEVVLSLGKEFIGKEKEVNWLYENEKIQVPNIWKNGSTNLR